MNESQLIDGCKDGDKKAQRTIFELYSKGMMAVCCRYVKDRQDAEEILLTGFLKFFRSIDRFVYTNEKSIGKWLKTIILNECFMLLRKNGSLKIVAEEYSRHISVVNDVLDKIDVAEIRGIIESMPVGYRVVFNLFVMEGYNHKEISEILDIAEGTSKSQLCRAKIFLQKQLTIKDASNGK